MFRLLRSFVSGIRYELGTGRALANVRATSPSSNGPSHRSTRSQPARRRRVAAPPTLPLSRSGPA